MNKAHTTTPKTSNSGSSQAEDRRNSSRVPSFPWRSGLAHWAAVTGIVFISTPVAWHSQASKN